MTIREVAGLAGVSQAAVSRYFNGGPLGEEKRERIRRAVEQTGFHPSQAAQMMRTGRSGQIGVIVPRIHSDSVSQIVAGVEEALRGRSYILILGCTDEKRENELRFLEAMQQNQVEGIILMGTVFTPKLRDAIRDCAVPVVVTGQRFEGVAGVYHDDYNAMRELMRRMVKRGRKHVLYLGVTEEDRAAGYERRRGAESAWNEAGLPAGALTRKITGFSYEDGMRAAAEALAADSAIDGVLCASDLIALGAMRALQEAGRRIPEEVSIAGIGDSWADCAVSPRLTSAHLYYDQCGSVAVKTLLDMLEQKGRAQPVRQVMLGYTIMERESL